MTHSLSATANQVVEPPTIHSIKAALSNDLLPAQPGIYCWWFDGELPIVPRNGTVNQDGFSLLYVGIAPSRPPKPNQRSPRDLKKRLRNHISGRVGTSTLRLSLASLLAQDLALGLFCRENGKRAMSKADEQRLSERMVSHARLAWLVDEAPWIIELELIKNGPRLPLNIKESDDPFRHELKKLRNSID